MSENFDIVDLSLLDVSVLAGVDDEVRALEQGFDIRERHCIPTCSESWLDDRNEIFKGDEAVLGEILREIICRDRVWICVVSIGIVGYGTPLISYEFGSPPSFPRHALLLTDIEERLHLTCFNLKLCVDSKGKKKSTRYMHMYMYPLPCLSTAGACEFKPEGPCV